MLRHPARSFWLVAALTIVADQLSKSMVRVLWSSPADRHPLDAVLGTLVAPVVGPSDAVPLLGEAFQLVYVRNEGAAFGLFPGGQPVFIITSVVVLVVVAAYWRRWRPTSPLVVIPLALVSAGSLGNLVDRALLGRVTDFFDVRIVDFPVFNIADSAIVIGVGVLIAWLLFAPAPENAPSVEECE